LRRTTTLAVLIGTALLSACGSSPSRSPSAAVTSTATAGSDCASPCGKPTTPTTSTQGFTPIGTWLFTAKDPDTGDSEAGSFALGRFGPSSAAASFNDTHTFASAPCQVDDQRDLVAPFEFTVRNTNQGFAQDVKESLWAVSDGPTPPTGDQPWLHAAVFYDAGPQCVGVTSFTADGSQAALGLDSNAQLQGGGSVTVDGYLILNSILTPDHPNGDPAVFKSLFLGLDQTETVTSTSDNWINQALTTGGNALIAVPETAHRIPLVAVEPAN